MMRDYRTPASCHLWSVETLTPSTDAALRMGCAASVARAEARSASRNMGTVKAPRSLFSQPPFFEVFS